jgi:hypothetical protein
MRPGTGVAWSIWIVVLILAWYAGWAMPFLWMSLGFLEGVATVFVVAKVRS